jgi:uncharacterized protein
MKKAKVFVWLAVGEPMHVRAGFEHRESRRHVRPHEDVRCENGSVDAAFRREMPHPGNAADARRLERPEWIYHRSATRIIPCVQGLSISMTSHIRVDRLIRSFCLVAAMALLLPLTSRAVEAASLRQGMSALSRQDYVAASRILIPLAERGDPAAQAYLGFMFETGRGVPQNYIEAAMWYRRSAEQGFSGAQYSLGLLYDRGQGVPQNIVEASKWLNLAAAAAPRERRDLRVRIRDAVTSKMTRGEIAEARLRALAWVPRPEH